ncbi:hypothetical protein NPIL_51451 [Nephila pilipes]|uniref:Uncharacterized protein n=1 Tax=Nephila pilipes TaxID=299642 RepID=A0A8X6UMX9_NEPPI|nr:hypothetical protein NPIL_51451 [Nephila pilipes]
MESSNHRDFQRQRQQLENSIEALILAPQNKVDILERTQNKALRLITGAVVSTLIALQSYTSNALIAVEIKKQVVNTLVRMKASHRANWMNDWKEEPS